VSRRSFDGDRAKMIEDGRRVSHGESAEEYCAFGDHFA
jgi:hypothetical protein